MDSICTTVRELEGTGYIVRKRERRADGTLGSIEYTILEQSRQADAPKRENPVQAEKSADAPKRAFPELVKPEQEKPAQLNIQEQSKEKQNTDVLTSFPSFWREDRSTQKDRMERRKIYSEQIRENISYDYLSNYTNADRERLDELVSLMLDTVCSTKSSIRVAGEELPAEVVRSRLLKLTGAHLLYVLDRINENTTEVRHVKPYLLTALYNAPLTMDKVNKQVNMTKEELKIKLYERMAQRIGDERFGLPAQQAAGRFTALQEQMGGHVGVYAVDSHSCVVDAAMAKLAEPERRPEREGADKRAQLER